MGFVAPAVPSKLGWVPCHCQKNGVKSPLFCCFLCVVGYPPNWGKRPRYIDIDRCPILHKLLNPTRNKSLWKDSQLYGPIQQVRYLNTYIALYFVRQNYLKTHKPKETRFLPSLTLVPLLANHPLPLLTPFTGSPTFTHPF